VASDRSDAEDRGVDRLLIAWTRPYHLTAAEADAWAQEAAARVAAAAGVRRAELMSLGTASVRHPCDGAWLLELQLGPDDDAHRIANGAPCAEMLLDLRLLGVQPRVALAERGVVLQANRG
jgi:hypothetical protein